jgi:hypothetical protein
MLPPSLLKNSSCFVLFMLLGYFNILIPDFLLSALYSYSLLISNLGFCVSQETILASFLPFIVSIITVQPFALTSYSSYLFIDFSSTLIAYFSVKTSQQ